MTDPDVHAALDKLGKTALQIADERNALLAACRIAFKALDDAYDVDEPQPGHPREYPFAGAGLVMQALRVAIGKAEEHRG